MKKIPIGIDDFEKIITGNYYYIDKSHLIKEILDGGAVATLIPRPRRFGKTLNLSMLKCFFENSDISHASLFDHLAIAQHKDAMSHQGQYPVIFITFKFIDSLNWTECLDKLKLIIAEEYLRHQYLLEGPLLNTTQKKILKKSLAVKRVKLFMKFL